MISFVFAVIIVSFLEIGAMRREKNNRTLFVFIVLAAFTLAMGYFYFSKTPDDSFANLFFGLVKTSF